MDDMVAPAPQDAGKPEFARVAAPAPTSASDPLFVTVRSFDGGRHKHGPCMWEPPAGALPAAGELCVIVRAIEEDGEGEQAVVIAFDRNDSAALDSDLITPLVDVLPGSPVDGQEIYFQNAAMATAGWLWRFRYRAGSASPYKWEAAGCSALLDEVAAFEACTSTSYGDPATIGPSITLPLAGDYEISHGAQLRTPNLANAFVSMSYAIGVTAAADADAVWQAVSPGPGQPYSSPARTRRKNGLAAGALLRAKYRVSGGSGAAGERWLRAMPVRVG